MEGREIGILGRLGKDAARIADRAVPIRAGGPDRFFPGAPLEQRHIDRERELPGLEQILIREVPLGSRGVEAADQGWLHFECR